MTHDRHIDHVLADCVGKDANKSQPSVNTLRGVLRSDPNFRVFPHPLDMPRILKSMNGAVNDPKQGRAAARQP
jgi:hypothetical protein